MKSERTITFIVTKNCQLRCRYCYLVGKKDNQRMTFSTAREVCDYLLTNNNLFIEKSVVLDFIGGEPLMEIELIDGIVDYFLQGLERYNHKWIDNCRIRITTNGLLYNSAKVQNFVKKFHDILDISISIDGTKRKNDLNRIFPSGDGSYEKVVKNVRKWVSQFQNVATKMVISHDDIPYISESAIHLINLGIYRLDMNTVVEDVWKEGDDTLLEEQLITFADYIIDHHLYDKCQLYVFEQGIGHPLEDNNFSSPCGSMNLSVDNRGNFFTCLRFADFSLRSKPERCIGNVRKGIDKNLIRPYLTINKEALLPPQCLKCEVASGCKWCPAENYDSSSTGTIFEKTLYICKMHKARVRAKNYFWNRLKTIDNTYGE